MSSVTLGETWSSGTYEVRDALGNLGDAGSVTYTVTDATGAITTAAAAAHLGTGKYGVDYTPPGIGWHGVTTTATGGILAAGITRTWQDTFTVDSSWPVVSVDDAIEHMRAQDVITGASDREQLAILCRVATEAIELDLGRVIVPRTVVETLTGGRRALALTKTPVISVIGVTEAALALATDGTAYTLDAGSGLLYRGTSTGPASAGYWSLVGAVVTYRAGYITPPWVARQVALRGITRMWQGSQQAPLQAYDDVSGDTAVFSPAGVLTPLELGAYEALRAPAIA